MYLCLLWCRHTDWHSRCSMEDGKKLCFRVVLKALAFPHLCFSQAVGNSCPPSHNVPWWIWATKLELSHSASHLHCYWLTLPITCCQCCSPHCSTYWVGKFSDPNRQAFLWDHQEFNTSHRTNFCASTTNRSFIILTNLVTDEMYPRVADRRWCLLCRNSRHRFVQWRSTLGL